MLSLQHENEISNAAESQRIPITYTNSDDEDLAGSGEIEGSAGEEDYHPNTGNQHRNTDAKARKYLILYKAAILLIIKINNWKVG